MHFRLIIYRVIREQIALVNMWHKVTLCSILGHVFGHYKDITR